MFEKAEGKSFSVINFFSEEAAYTGNTHKITFTGYLLNRVSVMEQLRQTGYALSDSSDGALMLGLYLQFGKDCVQKAKGMYAFVIRDLADGSLFLARDRVGGKPLYYAQTADAFIAAPDLKGILKENLVEKQVNKTALAQYLMLSYIPAPLTILENVYKLSAGHHMTVSAEGTVDIQQYWDVVYDDQNRITDYEECKRQLRKTLFESVEEYLGTDPSAGILLSGGIDSNIITGVASQVTGKPIDTFSIGYKNEKEYDESDRAALSARFHKTNHHLFMVEYQNVLDNLDKVIENIDEPYADSSYLPTYTISRIAGEHTKSVLTGDAGDELFAGYNKYLIGYYSDIYKKIPGFIRNGIIKPLVDVLPANKKIVRKLNKVIDNSFEDTYTQRRNMMCLGVRPDVIDKLLTYKGSDALDFVREAYSKYEGQTSEVNQALYTDFKVVLEGDMLPKAERTSTLAGIVSKAPILHPDMVELVSKIPVEYKIRAKDRKIIFKETFADFIPKEILTATKTGFAVPVSYWFQNELKSDLLQTLNREMIEAQGLLNPDYVEYLVQEHINNRTNYGGILWALYIFEKWYQRYFMA